MIGSMSPSVIRQFTIFLLSSCVMNIKAEPFAINIKEEFHSPEIRLGGAFKSFDEFRGILNEWMSANHQPFRVASSEKLRADSGQPNETFIYRYIVYHCIHYGEPRKRGTGQRPNQNYVACGCRAAIRLNYSFLEKCLKITTMRVDHVNHETSAEAFAEFKVKKEDTPATGKKLVKRRASSTTTDDSGVGFTPKGRGIRTRKMKKEEIESSASSDTPTPDDSITPASENSTDPIATPVNSSTDDNEEIDVVSTDDWHPAPPPGLPAPVAQHPYYNPHFMPVLYPMQPYFMMGSPYPFYNFSPYGQYPDAALPPAAGSTTGITEALRGAQQTLDNTAPIATPVVESPTDNKENVEPSNTEDQKPAPLPLEFTDLKPPKSAFTQPQEYATLQPVQITSSQGCAPSTIQSTIDNLQRQLMDPTLGAERQAELQSLLAQWG